MKFPIFGKGRHESSEQTIEQKEEKERRWPVVCSICGTRLILITLLTRKEIDEEALEHKCGLCELRIRSVKAIEKIAAFLTKSGEE